MQLIWAKTALLTTGWADSVRIQIADDGTIASCHVDTSADGCARFGVILPAPVNLHSHAFQRAMAGLTEARGPDKYDSFWTWRKLMYRFLDYLTPEDVQAITAQAQMEMLEAGFACVCEFHYLHHQPGGKLYDNLAEMAERVAAATAVSGIGLTMLPVLYQYGGLDQRPLSLGQIRFGNTLDQFSALLAETERAIARLPRDTVLGVAPHSLRAVSKEGLTLATQLRPECPLHIHVAEQLEEVEQVIAHTNARPVQWLLSNCDVSDRWCMVHVTQMIPEETINLARSGAVAGLCPSTEASLGDGIFDGERFVTAGGNFGVGTDSNITISLTQELRGIEYSQRLLHNRRSIMATEQKSTGRFMFDQVCLAGASVAGRKSGLIAPGYLADLFALQSTSSDLTGLVEDTILDSFIFTGSDKLISDVWSAGRHLVKEGSHIHRTRIEAAYRKTQSSLIEKM